MSASTGSTKFHLSLSVGDISRSARFYEFLFGLVPARREPDYAKFEVCDPPLVLSLIPGSVMLVRTQPCWLTSARLRGPRQGSVPA